MVSVNLLQHLLPTRSADLPYLVILVLNIKAVELTVSVKELGSAFYLLTCWDRQNWQQKDLKKKNVCMESMERSCKFVPLQTNYIFLLLV